MVKENYRALITNSVALQSLNALLSDYQASILPTLIKGTNELELYRAQGKLMLIENIKQLLEISK